MTQQINYSEWTSAYLEDRLKQHLATIETKDEAWYDNRKYYNRAHDLLKIGAFRPVPSFIVSLSDLSPRLVKELHSLDARDREFVLKQAVGRIFEDINPELYHNSISRVLRVKLQ